MSGVQITPRLLIAAGAPRDRAEEFAPILARQAIVPGDGFNSITSRNGVAMLLGQLGHESAGFTAFSESLDYSPERLRQIFPSVSVAEAQRLGRGVDKPADQHAIANRVYGGRMGNIEPDDGWMFRGGGLIQLTGRNNYAAFAASIGRLPEQAAIYARTPEGAVASALWFWRANGCINPAFRGDVVAVTRIINPGQVRQAESGNRAAQALLQDRQARFNRVLAAIG